MKLLSKNCVVRLIAILFAAFLATAAFDKTLSGFGVMIRLIPPLLIIIALLVACRFPKIGATIYILLGITFTLAFQTYQNIPGFLFVSLPSILIGILFFLFPCKKSKKKK
jgi:hypothetical protein